MAQPNELKKKVLEKFNGRCTYCGSKLTLQSMCIDHFTPLLKTADDLYIVFSKQARGMNTFENKVPACKPCTASKKNRNIEEWREAIEASIQKLRREESTFKLMERFSLVSVNNRPIEFYFEKLEKQKTLES